jgi:hypothetical protein
MESNPVKPNQNTIPDLDRVAFFDFQRLAAGDLNAAAMVQRALRWLHNRSLHGWGIGDGFAVTGIKGDRQVQISPGYAIDCLGREIILTEQITKPVPAKAGDAKGKPVLFYLVAAYPDDANLTVVERREGECGTSGATRFRDQAALYWKAQGEQAVADGMEIVLAQAAIQNCALAGPLSLEQRRSARPPQQPHVVAGETNSGNTNWEVWSESDGDGTIQVGLQTVVDTSAARFGSTPLYHARLGGNLSPFEFNESRIVFDGITLVTDPTTSDFTFRVLLPRDLRVGSGISLNPDNFLADDLETFAAPRARNTWSVAWVGVEG